MAIMLHSMRSKFATEFFQSLTDPKSDDDYYMFYGRAKPWETEQTPTTVDTIKEQNDAKRNIIFYQKIIPSDVSLVAPRYNWTSGVVYDQYEDDVQLWKLNKKYYVLVREGDTYAIFVCLSNNNGRQSTVVPPIPTTGGAATQEIITSDGYIWKYLYTLTDEMEKFLTTTYLPVLILDKISYNDARALALAVKADSTNGSIQKITVDTGATFTTLVNVNLDSSPSSLYYRVTSFNNTTLVLTTTVGPQMSSVSGFYDNNYLIFFENGKLGTIDSYTVSNGVATITLCELYPNDGNPITNGIQFSILPKINVKGNGSGAVAIPKFTNNVLTSIDVLNGGQNYNFAEAFFLINTTATLSVVIPPDGGHGFNILSELKPTNILISKDLSFGAIPDNNEKYFGNGSYLRQIGIVKNIQTNLDQNPNTPSNTYDMVLKYDGTAGVLLDYTLPNHATSYILKVPPESQDGITADEFFIVGQTYTGFDDSTPTKRAITAKLIEKKTISSGVVLYFETSSDSYVFSVSTVAASTILDPNGEPYRTAAGGIATKSQIDDRSMSNIDVYQNLSNFENSTGNINQFGFNVGLRDTNNQLVGSNFFNQGDVVQFYETSSGQDVLIISGVVETIISPSKFGRGNALGIPSTISGTTLKIIPNYLDLNSKLYYAPDFEDYTNTLCLKWVNVTKNKTVILNETQAGYADFTLIKDKNQLFSLSVFDNYLFSSPTTAPVTAPTHLLGNDTLSTAKIESFSKEPTDQFKFNLKLSSPSDDFETATFTQSGSVSSGESVTLFRMDPDGISNKFTKIGYTKNLYVLSENYDVSSPNNIPDTISASAVSKIILQKQTNFSNSVIPNGSYLYRESTATKDEASGYVIGQDSSTGTSTLYKNVYVQMEKGVFENGDTVICVVDPFVKNITLFDSSCAGNTSVSAVTVFGNEQRYGGLFLNKYSGEVLYIQNIDPIQLATNTSFTTNILLGF